MSKYRVIRWRRENGVAHGVAGPPGRKKTPVVILGTPIRLLKVPNAELNLHSEELDGGDVASAVTIILEAGNHHGITKGAKDFLEEAA